MKRCRMCVDSRPNVKLAITLLYAPEYINQTFTNAGQAASVFTEYLLIGLLLKMDNATMLDEWVLYLHLNH